MATNGNIPEKDPITCHILDTSLGRPAADVQVILELLTAPQDGTIPTSWAAKTDRDGRVKIWAPAAAASDTAEVVPLSQVSDKLKAAGLAQSTWTLTFDSGGYFGGPEKTFFPEITVTITVKPGEHYHVPLLLAPYSYSTYRGS